MVVCLGIDVFSSLYFTTFDVYWNDLCSDLRKQIDLLEKNISRLKKEKEKTLKKQVQLQSKISILEKNMKLLKEQLAESVEQYASLKEKSSQNLEWETKRYSTLSKEYNELNDQYQSLLKNTEELENKYFLQKLCLENTQLKKQLEILENQKEKDAFLLKKQEFVKQIILKLLIQRKVSLSDIRYHLTRCGFFQSEAEIYQEILSLQSNYSISRNITKNGMFFSIQEPMIETDKKILIDFGSKKEFNFFLFSDLHYFDTSSYLLPKLIDQINEYCLKEQISYAFHLGDFYSFFRKCFTFSDVEKYKKLEETLVRDFPLSPSLIYGFLGGNHDKLLFPIGIDTMKNLEGLCSQFLSLGYSDCFLSFLNQKDMIAFHHPDRRISLESSENPWDYLNQYYRESPYNRARVVYDFFGHLHQFFGDSKFTLVPSLTKDRFQNGAVHGKLIFNSKGRISEIIIIPLELCKEFIPKQEIVYSKVRKR